MAKSFARTYLPCFCEERTSHSNRTLPGCQPTAVTRGSPPMGRRKIGASDAALDGAGPLSKQADVDESQGVFAKGLHVLPEAVLEYPQLDPQFLVVQQPAEGPLSALEP